MAPENNCGRVGREDSGGRGVGTGAGRGDGGEGSRTDRRGEGYWRRTPEGTESGEVRREKEGGERVWVVKGCRGGGRGTWEQR